MSDELEAIILNAVPAGDLDLGFFVLNKRQPLQNCYNPLSSHSTIAQDLPATSIGVTPAVVPLPPPQANDVEAKDFRSWSESVRSTKLIGGLSKALSAAFRTGKKLNADRQSPLIEVHTMKNQLDWFSKAQKDPGVRNWVEDKLKYTSDFYMVVGYSAMDRMSITSMRGGDLAASAKAVLAVPGLDPTGELLKAEGGGSHESATEQHLRATFSQKIICAVQYQKLKFRLFQMSRKDIEEASIGTKWERWIILDGARGRDSDIVAGVEATFCDDDDDDDEEEGVLDWGDTVENSDGGNVGGVEADQ